MLRFGSKKILLAWVAVAAVSFTAAPADGLVFSQYYEGSSGSNRALEIWNPGTTTIDFALTPLTIENLSNGSTLPGSAFMLSTGLLGPGEVLVISNTDAAGDAALLAAGVTRIDTTSGALNFNGNDALRLSLNGIVQDIIGQIGTEPGAAGWNGNGVSTVNQNIELNSPLLVTGDLVGSDPYDPSVRFQMRAPADVTAASFAGFGQVPVPEPSSLALLGVGGLLLVRRRRA